MSANLIPLREWEASEDIDRINNRLQDASDNLPHWHFERYGFSSQKIAAYPPKGVCFDAWVELSKHYSIWAVCGPFYVI